MKKTKVNIFIKVVLLILALIPFAIEWFNHIQYKVRSPEMGLLTRKTLLGYPCSYDLLGQDERGNLYVRTLDSVILFNDNGDVMVYHLGSLANSAYVNVECNSIVIKDLKKMEEYIFDKNGKFIQSIAISDVGEVTGGYKINTRSGIYTIYNDYIFSYVIKQENKDNSELICILKSVNNEFIYFLYAIDYILQTIFCIIHISYIVQQGKRHHRSTQEHQC